MKPSRPNFMQPGLALTAGALAGPLAGGGEAPVAWPNILVIMSDQHSKHLLGCYGNDLVRTPHLDRLAAEGMRFSNAYCPAPLCVPSRMSFLTGRFPSGNRVWSNLGILNSGIPTWAHALTAAGYETSLIGRMHFCGGDQRHGFLSRPIAEYSATYPGVGCLCDEPIGAPFYHGGAGQTRSAAAEAGRGKTTYQYMDERIVDAACAYLGGHAGTLERPFAAVVGLVLPHCPYIAPKELFDYYYERIDLPAVEEEAPATIRRFRELRDIERPLSEHQTRVARAAYYGLCEYTDLLVGKVLAALEGAGRSRDTLVVYCSDHGDAAGEHGCWWKSTYYEGSAGVPLIARMPGVAPAATECKAVCNLAGLGPTFMDAAGAQTLTGMDGRSLWPWLRGQRPDGWTDETFSELCQEEKGEYRPSRMVRSGKWKLWHYAGKDDLPPALFDLDEDPGEIHDLGGDPAHADIRDRLMARLLEGWDPAEVREGTGKPRPIFKALARWGQVHGPACPDERMKVPPPAYEAQVEMLSTMD